MKRRVRELTALVMAVCMICGGIWLAKSAAYAAEVAEPTYTLIWEDYESPLYVSYSGGYTIEIYSDYTQSVNDGDTINIPEDPKKPGYAFLGWNGYSGGIDTFAEGNRINQDYDDGTFVLHKITNYNPGSGELTMYGYWQAFRYEISYSGEDASGIPTTIHGSSDSPIYYQQQVTLSESIPTRSGYTFSGWEYDGELYPSGGTFTVPDADYNYNKRG